MEDKLARLRIGVGTDLHALEDNGRKLILGGIEVQHKRFLGPRAHSDGDVLIHALIDAILGATGKGDIGCLFPDSDDQYKNCSSTEMLRQVIEMIPIEIVNVDVTIQCESPKIGPVREKMESNLAEILGIDKQQINIKGKTLEKLPMFGEGNEAIFVIASLLGYVNT